MGKSGNAKQRATSAVSEFGNTLKAQVQRAAVSSTCSSSEAPMCAIAVNYTLKNTAQRAVKTVLRGMAAKPAPF